MPAVISDLLPSVSVDGAVSAFMAQMMEYAPGEEMLLRHVCQSYDQLATGHRWPPLSTKALSVALVKRGCKRGIRNNRRIDGTRLTTIQFPAEVV